MCMCVKQYHGRLKRFNCGCLLNTTFILRLLSTYLEGALELPPQLLYLQLCSNDTRSVRDSRRGHATCLLQGLQLLQLLLEGCHLGVSLLIRQPAQA